ncbi:MAG TPA: methyltransferase domain-containing protein [Gemmataceae bacterium]|nr:methyltransferase domain-containing protein [Gemmataceae bacterium]
MSFLRQRQCCPEIMDQPDLKAEPHIEALRALARINYFSNSAGILWPNLAELARTMAPRVPRVLDIATGGGDVPIRLWRRAQRAGIDLHLEGCDLRPVALEHARKCAASTGAPIRFFEYDARSGPTLTGYDAIMCSLFLHHQDEGQAIALLRRMADMAGRLVLVNDLERRWIGWLAAHVVSRVLTTSYVVHVDGPLSVAAAFTPCEALALADRAGLSGARVDRRWPFRWLLTWRRS